MQVPIYALLLFGGPVSVNHVGGGLTIGTKDAMVKLKAWPRIGVLVNHLRCVSSSLRPSHVVVLYRSGG